MACSAHLVACRVCGACCHGRPGTVLLSRADFRRWELAGRADLITSCVPGHFGQEGLAVNRSGACMHLDAGCRCGIYELRPDTCRQFRAGCRQCVLARRRVAAQVVAARVTAWLERVLAARCSPER
ncbi:MAG: YkgJ family cysteine cluster protein [Deltaproteobacteria bacterium]|nr:YkgJ family cysteine cluster protein [Deltaproteobacteria bacterium]MBW2537208.1 YkgJ family cysteine cluster protein [Deltaproteobacteria bacterium]